MEVLHVFPYHVAHLGLTFDTWVAALLQKWPIATLRYSSRHHHVIVMADSYSRRNFDNVTIESIPAPRSGPKHCCWGTDWSRHFERTLYAISNVQVFIHLNGYYSANMTIWCLQGKGNQLVSVLHGMGFNVSDCRYVASTICLRTEHWNQIREAGLEAKLVNPSVDCRFKTSPEVRRERRICFVSTIIPYKGTDTVIRVINHMIMQNQVFHLDILGTGKSVDVQHFEQQLRDALSDSKLCSYQMHGHVSMEAINEVLTKSALMIHPSITEGYSIAVTEALATGCPVIALSGVHDVRLSEEVGLFCVSVEDFPAKVLEVFNRPVTPTNFSPVYHHVGVETFDADYSGNFQVEVRIPKPPYSTRIKSMNVLSPVKKLWRMVAYGGG